MKITLNINVLPNGDYRAQIIEPKTMTREGPFHWKTSRMPEGLMALIEEKVAGGAGVPYCIAMETTLKDLYAGTVVH